MSIPFSDRLRGAVSCTLILVLAVGASGCPPGDGPAPPTAPSTSSGQGEDPEASAEECPDVALLLAADDLTPRAGATITVTVEPDGCAIDERWAGEIIVTIPSGKGTRTGVRMEAGATEAALALPDDIVGEAVIMLVADEDCADTADCHLPYVEIDIQPAR
jgi:hypothetical protein